jgi:putative peptide zinc metalloprotease protein
VRSCPAKLAEGVELLGEYEGSGYKQVPYIARRGDGQVIQLTQLLHMLAEEADGERANHDIARRVSERFGRKVSAGNVQFLVERKLRPLGVLAAADGTSPKLKKANPLLALRFRTALVPDRVVSFLTRFLWPLFLPPVLALVLAGVVALDVWLFFFHGVAPGLRAALYDPTILIMMFGFVVLATGFHELGHATACRYGGARPGALGAGIYVVWPVFYCDVTDAYRLGKGGRLRVDLGGVYFNGVFALACGGVYLATGYEPLLFVVVLQHLAVLQQLLPVLRLDGYYVISDLTGVPDILTRIRPILRSLVPGREADQSVKELKPWVRVMVSAYVVALVPILLMILTMVIISAPRVFATAWDSLGMQIDRMRGGLSGGRALPVISGGLRTMALVLPAAGTTASLTRLGRGVLTGLGRWARGRPPRMAAMGVGLALVTGLAAFTWWPNGDYRPIGPEDRGTIGGVVRSVEKLPTGRPSVASSPATPNGSPETPAPSGSSPAEPGQASGQPEAPDGERGGSSAAEEPSAAERRQPSDGRESAQGPEKPGSPASAEPPAQEPGGSGDANHGSDSEADGGSEPQESTQSGGAAPPAPSDSQSLP